MAASRISTTILVRKRPPLVRRFLRWRVTRHYRHYMGEEIGHFDYQVSVGAAVSYGGSPRIMQIILHQIFLRSRRRCSALGPILTGFTCFACTAVPLSKLVGLSVFITQTARPTHLFDFQLFPIFRLVLRQLSLPYTLLPGSRPSNHKIASGLPQTPLTSLPSTNDRFF